jgi:hypothetical protein
MQCKDNDFREYLCHFGEKFIFLHEIFHTQIGIKIL